MEHFKFYVRAVLEGMKNIFTVALEIEMRGLVCHHHHHIFVSKPNLIDRLDQSLRFNSIGKLITQKIICNFDC